MADQNVAQLPAAGTLNGAELLYTAQSGADRQLALGALQAFVLGGLPAALSAETARAEAAEAAEQGRAEAAEGVLTAAVAAEQSRALAAESALAAGTTAETGRALAAEAVLTAAIAAKTGLLSINQPTASYTLQASDVCAQGQGYIGMNVATTNTLTIPAHATVAFPVGYALAIAQLGAGQTTIVAATDVTVLYADSLQLRRQYSQCSAVQIAQDVWALAGDFF